LIVSRRIDLANLEGLWRSILILNLKEIAEAFHYDESANLMNFQTAQDE